MATTTDLLMKRERERALEEWRKESVNGDRGREESRPK